VDKAYAFLPSPPFISFSVGLFPRFSFEYPFHRATHRTLLFNAIVSSWVRSRAASQGRGNHSPNHNLAASAAWSECGTIATPELPAGGTIFAVAGFTTIGA